MTATLGNIFAQAVDPRRRQVRLASGDDSELDTDFSVWDKLDAQALEIKRQRDFEDAVRRLQTHPGNSTLHAVPQPRYRRE